MPNTSVSFVCSAPAVSKLQWPQTRGTEIICSEGLAASYVVRWTIYVCDSACVNNGKGWSFAQVRKTAVMVQLPTVSTWYLGLGELAKRSKTAALAKHSGSQIVSSLLTV